MKSLADYVLSRRWRRHQRIKLREKMTRPHRVKLSSEISELKDQVAAMLADTKLGNVGKLP